MKYRLETAGQADALLVEEPIRLKGLGTYLLKAAEEFAKENGASMVITNAGDRSRRESLGQNPAPDQYEAVHGGGGVKRVEASVYDEAPLVSIYRSFSLRSM